MKRIFAVLLDFWVTARAFGLYLLAVALAMCGTAFAQDAIPSIDPSSWGSSPFKLAAAVLFITASLKRAADRKGIAMKAYLWWSISLTLGILGAAALNLLGYGATLGLLVFPWGVIVFGVVAGLVASGFRDLAKTISDWFQRPATLPAATVGEVLPPADLIQPAPDWAAVQATVAHDEVIR